MDRRSWAKLYAEEWWSRTSRPHGKREINALNAYAVGYVLFGFAGVNAAAGLVLLRVLRSRVPSYVRTLQVQQQADLDSTFRSDK